MKHRGVKRLQGEGVFSSKSNFYHKLLPLVCCFGLVVVLSECLKFFNEACSQDLLKTGRGSFTSTALAPATRPALIKFREQWITDGGPNTGLDLNLCTVNGGRCEHPDQLRFCNSGASKSKTNVSFVIVSFFSVLLLIKISERLRVTI